MPMESIPRTGQGNLVIDSKFCAKALGDTYPGVDVPYTPALRFHATADGDYVVSVNLHDDQTKVGVIAVEHWLAERFQNPAAVYAWLDNHDLCQYLPATLVGADRDDICKLLRLRWQDRVKQLKGEIQKYLDTMGWSGQPPVGSSE